jgi:protocatechuate 3,4-dioxygenase beta subunit
MTRRIDRRQAIGAFGTVSVGALFAACGDDRATSPDTASRFGDESDCTLTPELTEGPYYFDADKIRSDIRDGHEGTRLDLALRVRDASCSPLANAVVDLWQCDAEGSYSESGDPFLRGAQVTNKDGIAEFTTVNPGWYQGRTVHSHEALGLDLSREGDGYRGTISFGVAAS